MNEQTARVVAEWWASKFNRLNKMDIGDRTENAVYTQAMIATLQAYQPDIPEEKVGKFTEALIQEILDCERSQIIVGVDYHPDTKLVRAMEKAGIDPKDVSFPLKTTMWVRDDSIDVREGYTAQIEQIYPKEKI